MGEEGFPAPQSRFQLTFHFVEALRKDLVAHRCVQALELLRCLHIILRVDDEYGVTLAILRYNETAGAPEQLEEETSGEERILQLAEVSADHHVLLPPVKG